MVTLRLKHKLKLDLSSVSNQIFHFSLLEFSFFPFGFVDCFNWICHFSHLEFSLFSLGFFTLLFWIFYFSLMDLSSVLIDFSPLDFSLLDFSLLSFGFVDSFKLDFSLFSCSYHSSHLIKGVSPASSLSKHTIKSYP